MAVDAHGSSACDASGSPRFAACSPIIRVYDRRPNDADLLIAAVDTHHARLGRVPHLVAADAAFYSAKNEAAAKAKGVKRVCIPNRSTKSPERRREQKKRWFRAGQAWR